MSSRMSQVGPRTEKGKSGLGGGENKSGKDGEINPPLETRMTDFKSDTGVLTKILALHKRWASEAENEKWVEFYLPETDDLGKDSSGIATWVQYMEILISDLKWLLALPHNQFWSVMVFAKDVSQDILHSFCNRAPRFFDANYRLYETHDVIWPIYKTIYVLMFRVFMRLATFKESTENHISPSVWSKILHDNELINMRIVMDLSTLYESKDNPLFQKMVKHLLEYNERLMDELQEYIPLQKKKFKELCKTVETLISKNVITKEWDIEKFEQLLSFQLDTVYSLYKLLKVYPQAANKFLYHPNFVNSFATSYEVNTRLWGKVVAHLEPLEERVNLCRAGMLRLFRAFVANPTILSVESANDKRLDEFFDYFSSCIDEKVFIHDYEKAFPFRSDMQALLSRGIFVDETRIDYMANAISSCFHACGEEYSVEKIVVDPLYDPNFDRQLLGACSLEITGVELDSLITQVKDLLPELPSSYVEAVLKHYGYSAETTINALLEGSVPFRLEKYKNEEYIKSQSAQTTPVEDPLQDKLPVHFETEGENGVKSETFIPSRRDDSLMHPRRKQKEKEQKEVKDFEKFLNSDKDIVKSTVLQKLEESSRAGTTIMPRIGSNEEDENMKNCYIDAALLPTFNESLEYDDEYDDTYDDLGAGMTEPDNVMFNPLNRKKVDMMDNTKGSSPDDQEDEGNGTNQGKKFDTFCEDPAVVRERYERRRQEMHNRGGKNHQQPSQNPQPQSNQHDVVGRAKGQGQEKDVLYNRRQKTTNKGAGGSWKKRSDFKRKEF